MDLDLWSFILDNLEAAGAIGGYVSLSIIGFALISYVTRKNQLLEKKIGPKWTHPFIGALMGAIPGCGATIVVASLYKNRKISFGGLFATFISTLGEGSFVLLGASDESQVAGNLKAYVTITVFGLAAGIIFGFLTDLIGFRVTTFDKESVSTSDHKELLDSGSFPGIFIEKLGFYAILAMAIFLAPGSIMALWGSGIDTIADPTTWISISLTLTCILYYVIDRFVYKHHECHCDEDDFKSSLLHAILDVAMVISYVFLGLLVANFILDVLVGPETFASWMTSSPYIVVLIAALIGVTPGCGGMIAVAVAFITIPNFPMAALIAAAIATSGDGIFPLLAENRKDGIIVSLCSLAVAILVGYLALFLGF